MYLGGSVESTTIGSVAMPSYLGALSAGSLYRGFTVGPLLSSQTK